MAHLGAIKHGWLLGCFLIAVLLSARVSAEEIACDPDLVARVRAHARHPYSQRGDRCEGLYAQDVAGGSVLTALSFTASFDNFDPSSVNRLILTWRRTGLVVPDNRIQVRAQSRRPKLYYRMDTLQPFGKASYEWTAEILTDLKLGGRDIGVMAWTRRRLGELERVVHVPLEIGADREATRSDQYALVVVPGTDLEEVYWALLAVDPQGRPARRISARRDLGLGLYPAGRSFEVRIPAPREGGALQGRRGCSTAQRRSHESGLPVLQPRPAVTRVLARLRAEPGARYIRDLTRRRVRALVDATIEHDGHVAENALAEAERLDRLATLAGQLRPDYRIPGVLLVGGVALVIFSLLWWSRLQETEIALVAHVSEISFTLERDQPLMGPTPLASLSAAGLSAVEVPSRNDAAPRLLEATGRTLDIRTRGDGRLTLDPGNLPAKTTVWLRPADRPKTYLMSLSMPKGGEILATARGQLTIRGLDEHTNLLGKPQRIKFAIGLETATDFTIEVAEGDEFRLTPELAITRLSLLRVPQHVAPSDAGDAASPGASSARLTSTIIDGTVFLEDLKGKELKLYPGQKLFVSELEDARLLRMVLGKDGIGFTLRGTVRGLRTGLDPGRHSIMPNRLEWLQTKDWAKLALGGLGLLLSLAAAIAQWRHDAPGPSPRTGCRTGPPERGSPLCLYSPRSQGRPNKLYRTRKLQEVLLWEGMRHGPRDDRAACPRCRTDAPDYHRHRRGGTNERCGARGRHVENMGPYIGE